MDEMRTELGALKENWVPKKKLSETQHELKQARLSLSLSLSLTLSLTLTLTLTLTLLLILTPTLTPTRVLGGARRRRYS